MAEAFIQDSKRILPAAVLLEGQYGIRGFFVGVPVRIGAGGVEEIFELQLDAQEKAELDKSVQSVKKTVDAVKL
jgi:malate dehydrogenase